VYTLSVAHRINCHIFLKILLSAPHFFFSSPVRASKKTTLSKKKEVFFSIIFIYIRWISNELYIFFFFKWKIKITKVMTKSFFFFVDPTLNFKNKKRDYYFTESITLA